MARTQALCEQLGETPHLFQALWFANTYHLSRAHFQTARSISEQLLAMGQRQEDPAMRMSAHTLISVPLYHLGEFHASLTHAESGLALYDPEQHRNLAFRFSQDPKARCLGCASWVLWTLGYPDRARQYSAEAVTHVRELSHPFSLAFALFVDTGVQLFCRDWQAAQELATECLGLSTEHGWAQFWAWSTWAHGLTLAQQGQTQEGIPQMRQGLSACESIGSAFGRSIFLSYLVKGYRQAGQTEESLAVLAEAEAFEERTGECWFESELQRLKGELLLDQGRDAAKAEQLFDTAVQVARSTSARSLELRATMSLCRLWQAQGKREQARQALEPIYGWFTEGFDTADLQEAKALLQTLSQPKGS